jgi:hypothetical protein
MRWVYIVKFIKNGIAPICFPFRWYEFVYTIAGLKSQAGNNKSVCWKFNDCLAKSSSFSFPRIPTWLGIQYNLTDFVLSTSWNRKTW